MGSKHPLRLGGSLVALLLGAVAPLHRAVAQNAGSVGAVNPSATGQPPGAGARTLTLGLSIVRDERLRTGPSGTLHVTLADRTTLNLGPNTNLVVDRFVFDPEAGSGALATTLTSGVLRFVGGVTSHEGDASIRTPTATIGIRGNMLLAEVGAGGLRVTSLGQGVIVVRNRVSEVRIERPGFTVLVPSADQPIAAPFRADPGVILAGFDGTTSRRGQRGGATRLPTDALAARQGLELGSLPSLSGSLLDRQALTATQGQAGSNAVPGPQLRRAIQAGRPAVPAARPTTPAAPTTPTTTRTTTTTTNPYGNAGN